jgi:hypothetical protein
MPVQVLPQNPQLLESLLKSTQPPPQQPGVTPVPLHPVPHAPQLALSEARSVQNELQQPGVVPPQVTPQPAQLSGSLVVSTQLPEQEVSVESQLMAFEQVPPVQVPPVPQAFPHEPQLLGSLSRSTQPLSQQAGVVPVPSHEFPQAPQL